MLTQAQISALAVAEQSWSRAAQPLEAAGGDVAGITAWLSFISPTSRQAFTAALGSMP